jgi:hypothetical protein
MQSHFHRDYGLKHLSSRRNNHDSDKEIEVDNTNQGEEEGMDGDEDNEK